jgi:hypothetical protein
VQLDAQCSETRSCSFADRRGRQHAGRSRSCHKKGGMGQAMTEDLAKFEVDAAILQSTDFGIYTTWVVGAGTPGYAFGKRAYRCSQDGAIWTCHGAASVCKL